jgi:Mce-associated membrane protein
VKRLPRVSDPVLATATVLLVVAAVCAAFFGWSWYRAAHDESLAYSRDRDAVLRAGEQGVQNMNTLDYRKVDQGLAAWEDSSTGDLHGELVKGRAQFTAQVQLAKTVTTAKILDGAVTELDDRTGKAGVIVAVQITVTPPTGDPTTKQSRMRAQLTRTPSGWKLSALGQAPVGTTANGG